MIIINGRFMTHRTTGVERVASQVTAHLLFRNDVEVLAPIGPNPLLGHAWEQLVLPFKAGHNVLWSPANFGPVAYRHQVLTVHDAAVWDHPEWFSPRYAAWFRTVVPIAAKRARLVTTVSEFSRRRILANVPQLGSKVVVIPHGTEQLTAETESHLPTGLEPGLFLLTVGSLEPRKNLGRLLDAWQVVRLSYPAVRLVMVGKGHPATFKEVTSPSASHDGVALLGHVSDPQLVSLYQSCLGFVFVSLYEGFGLPPVEAAAHGCRLVVSYLEPLNEVLGEGPIYVDPLSTDSITAGLLALLSGSAEGRARVAKRSWADVADELYACLRSVGR